MKHYLQRILAHRLETARLATVNAALAPVADALTANGVAATLLPEGKAFYESAAALVTAAAARRGDQMAATDYVKQCKREVRQSCQALAKVARGAFRDDPGALGILGLTGRMPSDNNSFLQAAQTLFNTTAYTPEMRATLLKFGYTDAKLSGERAKIVELQFALNTQAQTKSAFQQGQADQCAAMKALDRWMGLFVRVARVALAGKPQLLEQLGIVAPTFPTAAQRAGRVKASATRLKKKLQSQTMNLPKAA